MKVITSVERFRAAETQVSISVMQTRVVKVHFSRDIDINIPLRKQH